MIFIFIYFFFLFYFIFLFLFFKSEEGDLYSILDVGEFYLEGVEVEKDYQKAFKYFEIGRKQGNTWAYINLGYMLYNQFLYF